MAKIVIGFSSHSVAISADGFNNLSDAGMSLITLLGFHIARYGKGKIHPFGHGRFEWIMGIFTSLAVVLMGIKLVHTSAQAIVSPAQPLFSAAVVIILALSIATKGYSISTTSDWQVNGFRNFESNRRRLYQRFCCNIRRPDFNGYFSFDRLAD